MVIIAAAQRLAISSSEAPVRNADAQIGFLASEQAVEDLAVGRQAYAVAVAAERPRHRADDADSVRSVVDQELLGRRRATSVEAGQPEVLAQQRQRLVGGDHRLAIPAVLGVERHLLDEAQLVVVLHAPAQQVGRLGVVDATKQHGVDLDRRQPGLTRCGETVDHVVEPVASGDLFERDRIGRVEADVDPVESGLGQRLGGVLEAQTIGGHRRAGFGRQRLGRGNELGQAAAKQRLSPSEPHVADTEDLDTDADQAHQLVVGERVLGRHPVETFGGHAVLAPEVAAIGQRHAQVCGDPAVCVDELHGSILGAGGQPGGPAVDLHNYRRLVYRFLLSARWIGFAVFVIVLAAVCTRLGFWQIHRLEHRLDQNKVITTHLKAEPVELTQALKTGDEVDDASEFTRVRATGTYDVEHQVTVKFTTRDGAPGVDVVTPFVLSSGQAVLVDRGWQESENTVARPDVPAPPAGEVTITGWLRQNNGAGGEAIRPIKGQIRAISSVGFAKSVPYDLLGRLPQPALGRSAADHEARG